MTLGPFASEQVHDSQFDFLVEMIRKRPHMVISPLSFSATCAFLNGYDTAKSGAALMGFQPWLVLRRNGGNNMHWSGLVRQMLGLELDDKTLSNDEKTVQSLGLIIEEFLEYRRANGLTKIFRDYSTWLLRRSWYSGPLRPA